MKKWQKWTAIGISAAVVIALVVLHFVQPEVSYAYLEAAAFVSFLLGGTAGYLACKYISGRKEE